MDSHFSILCVLIVYLVTTVNNASAIESSRQTFKAAVYEHIPFLPPKSQTWSRQQALKLMNKNLDVFHTQSQKAKNQRVQLLVFPEDGIYGMVFNGRDSILPFLEVIPDPKQTKWNPCHNNENKTNVEVQQTLSCMAKDNNMYIIANMGDLVPCTSKTDPSCPADGRYQFNTDVAFDPEGNLVAKYHKTNLFYEFQFDAPKPEVVYFDTPFGRFGMLVCFDLLFEKPAITMVTKYNVTNVLFPTAWMDALPLLPAIGYHSSFARGLGINLLSSNIHLPTYRFQGSGLFTPKGAAKFYYSNKAASPGKLIVADLDVLLPGSVTIPGSEVQPLPKRFKTNQKEQFQSQLFNDIYTFEALTEPTGNINVCHKKVCCSLKYTIANQNTKTPKELFAFGAFDGLHTFEGKYYFQVCALVKCADNSKKSSCGNYTFDSSTEFSSFTIKGYFQTQFVYPQVVVAENKQLMLTDESAWFFSDAYLEAGPGVNKPLISAILLGRDYTRDSDPANQGFLSKPILVLLVFSIFVHKMLL